MRRALFLSAAFWLAACVTTPTVFEGSYLRPEFKDRHYKTVAVISLSDDPDLRRAFGTSVRSEEHTSELQSQR